MRVWWIRAVTKRGGKCKFLSTSWLDRFGSFTATCDFFGCAGYDAKTKQDHDDGKNFGSGGGGPAWMLKWRTYKNKFPHTWPKKKSTCCSLAWDGRLLLQWAFGDWITETKIREWIRSSSSHGVSVSACLQVASVLADIDVQVSMFPGLFVYSIGFGSEAEDVRKSYFGNVNDQVSKL